MKQSDWRIAMDRHMCHQNGPPPPWECAWQPYLPFLVRDGGGNEGGSEFCGFVEHCSAVQSFLHTMLVIHVDASWSQQQEYSS